MGAEHGAGRGEAATMVPVPMLGAHRLLLQENTTCNIWGNTTDYRRTPAEEDLSRTPHLVGAFVGLILALGSALPPQAATKPERKLQAWGCPTATGEDGWPLHQGLVLAALSECRGFCPLLGGDAPTAQTSALAEPQQL